MLPSGWSSLTLPGSSVDRCCEPSQRRQRKITERCHKAESIHESERAWSTWEIQRCRYGYYPAIPKTLRVPNAF
jgi:hypothetical protein